MKILTIRIINIYRNCKFQKEKKEIIIIGKLYYFELLIFIENVN